MFTFESNIASFYPYALKGQKLSITRQYTTLLPLQGVLLIAIIPRAMPWAKSFWAFSPYLNHMQNFNKLKTIIQLLPSRCPQPTSFQ